MEEKYHKSAGISPAEYQQKGGEKMYLETVKKITAVENETEQAKAAARAQVQQKLAESERAGKELLVKQRADCRAQREELLGAAREKAEAQRQEMLRIAAADCQQLRRSAQARMDAAVEEIVRRVVER